MRITYRQGWKGILIIFMMIPLVTIAQQTITGTFHTLANQKVRLFGFEGFNTYAMDSTSVSENGIFKLSYGPKDYGMGYITADDNESFIVILAPAENLELRGEVLSKPESVIIISGKQNQLFAQYASEHRRREQALSAWDYLEKIYHSDSLFLVYKKLKIGIEQEKKRIKEEDKAYLSSLNPKTYLSWFLPVRKLVSSVSTIAQYRTEEIPATITTFRNLDYTDPRLYKSGLLRETIESHFWLIENSGHPLDSLFTEMNVSIDFIIESLSGDAKKLNEIIDYLFKLLEQRSLFESAEYLALKVLDEDSYIINEDLAAQLESYRAMKIGNVAPDFEFNVDVLAPGYASAQIPKKLSDINTNYTVLVFGSSWCPACPQELMQIAGKYQNWRNHDVEVVFISLDEDYELFKNFASAFPFISISDYQKWESPIVKSYHVFATPTIYLMDENRKILLRPNSVKQLDSWIDWYVLGNN